MGQTSERMSKVDTAWLRMDTEANLMMIVGVWSIRPGITLAALRERVAERLLQYPRFRQKVVEDALLGAQWVVDRDFDIARHVVAELPLPLRGQSRDQVLRERVAELCSEPLDPAHPLWQFQLIEDMGDGTSALIARIHHCIADGIALIAVMLSITDGGKAPPQRARARAPEVEEEADWLLDAFLRPLSNMTVKAIGLTGKGVSKGVDTVMSAGTPMDASMEMARMGYQAVSDVAAFALMPDDSPTRLKGKPGATKTVAWDDSLALDEVKAVGKALGASINDVLLACAAGAIGRYLADKGEDPAGKEIRAMVPVNLRPLEHAWQLGNRFGLVPLVLPIGIANPVERLFAVRARMSELKGSFQPVMAFGLLSVAGLLIKPVQHAMLNIFARKATAVMTNVPGPAEALKFCGATVEKVMFWVPQSGDIGMGVSILTYAGRVQFGLITDTGLCPDPEAIIANFAPEFEKLLMLSLMMPWDGDTA
ncbi:MULTISPECIES: wax ester/triacylglycerol synthase family O-acyltransferase [unclassified Roseateles]|uniref:wax ester/triacylglycerol synthase family O-acyltransferase n=1 Tax=unclassified Roseateles TaxID=2626991 RepID=UPI0006F48281|nr:MULTISPECIES: wax ester/triacylglycerol synthase family O-acyltransferase [unclassified Roseateles]KQW42912.1 diacylglycerol O-acyltransferase [Pelomonas sp. Root405]KRA69590.1 diacylglycerol O-acyltransferase [Pelomonas sp. Root662]